MKDIHIYEMSLFDYEKKAIFTQLPYDKKRYNLIYDAKNPDYVLVPISHLIASQKIYEEFKEKYDSKKIYIFFGDECISPDLNLFDYAITYDDEFVCRDRVYRHPINWIIREFLRDQNQQQIDYSEEYKKRRFCNFIYYNSLAHPKRDELFYAINNYQRVDALGKHLNNCEVPITRFQTNYFDISVEMKSNYRFSIAAENDNFYGNTTEKIISSFYAHTVPIYWGNPNIASEFNEKAFINCHRYQNFEEVLEIVKAVNEDKDKWIEMVNQPMKTDDQIEKDLERMIGYERFVNHIFEQTIEEAKRVTIGTAEKSYIDFWIEKLQWRKKENKLVKENFFKLLFSDLLKK